MATIGSLIVEIAGDNSRLRRSLNESKTLTDGYKRQIRDARNDFADSATRMREDLFRGALSPSEFAKQGHVAAKRYNDAIIEQIDALRRSGNLTPKLHAALVASMHDAGLDAANEFNKTFTQRVDEFGARTVSKGRAISQAGSALTAGVTLPVVGAGVASFKSAADAAESANKFMVLFGEGTEFAQRRLDELHRTIPVTTRGLQDMASNFMATLAPLGLGNDAAREMSLRLTELAGDLQSLHNEPFEEVMRRLTSGIVGEAEAVRRYGADIRETGLQNEALRNHLGKNVNALTQAQLAQLRYNIIMRATGNATGDAARTVDSATNSVRFLSRDAHELATVIGTRLIPMVLPMIQRFTTWLETMQKTSPALLDTAIKVGMVAAAIGPLLLVLGQTTIIVGGLARAFALLRGASALGGLATLLTGPAGIIIGVGAAAAALLAWGAYARAAKIDTDALARSFADLSMAQLRERMVAENAELLRLRGEQTRVAGRTATTSAFGAAKTGVGLSAQQQSDDERRIANAIKVREANLVALAKAIDTVFRKEQQQAREREAIFAQQRALAEEAKRLAESVAGGGTAKKGRDPVADLEALVSQITQTDRATAGAVDTTDALVAAWRRALALQQAGARLSETQALRLDEIIGKIERIALPVPGVASTASTRPVTPMTPVTRSPVAAPVAGDVGAARLQYAQVRLAEIVGAVGASLSTFGAGLGRVLVDAVNPVNLLADIVYRIAGALRPVLDPLAPVFEKLARVVARTLGPVFEALAPVLESLIPVVDAVMQVIAPILKALAPLLGAFVPLFRALFPVFKLVAIAATYIGQVFAIVGSVILRVVGNIAIGFGKVVEGIARAVDKLPGVSAKGAIEAGKNIQNFGRELLTSSDEFKESAREMARARDEIRKVSLDKTSEDVKKLGEAARETTDAMRNVPTWWKVNLAVWRASNPLGGSGTVPGTSPGWEGPRPPQTDVPTTAGGSGPRPKPTPEQTTVQITFENVNIDGNRDGREVLREMIQEAQRISLATFGTTTRWADVVVT